MLAVFDLEGPLTPMDHAYEMMALIPNGKLIFETISYYDDLLTLEGRENYEPGTTLALILPFLIRFNVNSQTIYAISQMATLTPGAESLIKKLKEDNFEIVIISSSFYIHANNIAKKLNVDNVIATHLPPLPQLSNEQIKLIDEIMLGLTKLQLTRHEILKEYLDSFYNNLRKTALGKFIFSVEVIGGARKLQACRQIMQQKRIAPECVIAVGDSITDMALLKWLREAGGLAIAFNANIYALAAAEVAIAANNVDNLYPIFYSYKRGGRKLLRETIAKIDNCHIVNKKKLKSIVSIHHYYRNQIRGTAGKLG